jgi:hypothetical protein
VGSHSAPPPGVAAAPAGEFPAARKRRCS